MVKMAWKCNWRTKGEMGGARLMSYAAHIWGFHDRLIWGMIQSLSDLAFFLLAYRYCSRVGVRSAAHGSWMHRPCRISVTSKGNSATKFVNGVYMGHVKSIIIDPAPVVLIFSGYVIWNSHLMGSRALDLNGSVHRKAWGEQVCALNYPGRAFLFFSLHSPAIAFQFILQLICYSSSSAFVLNGLGSLQISLWWNDTLLEFDTFKSVSVRQVIC